MSDAGGPAPAAKPAAPEAEKTPTKPEKLAAEKTAPKKIDLGADSVKKAIAAGRTSPHSSGRTIVKT